MLKLSHVRLIVISGLVWLAVGAGLLPFGLKLLIASTQPGNSTPLVNLLSPYLGGEQQVALMLVAIGMFVGYWKSKKVLSKTVVRSVMRIRSLPNPTSIFKIYAPGYYVLLGGMMGLGMSMQYFGIPIDIRGAIDVAIGSALINGAMTYFRSAAEEPTPNKG